MNHNFYMSLGISQSRNVAEMQASSNNTAGAVLVTDFANKQPTRLDTKFHHPSPQSPWQRQQRPPITTPTSPPLRSRSLSPASWPHPTSSPAQPIIKNIRGADMIYPDPCIRTPPPGLLFPLPKKAVDSFDLSSPILEEFDAEMVYMEGMEPMREGDGVEGMELERPWRGYVEYKESSERWSLRKEAKRRLEVDSDERRKKAKRD